MQVPFGFIEEPDLLRRRLEEVPQDFLSALGPPVDDSAPRYALLTFYRCHGENSFVTITNFAEMAAEENPVPVLGTIGESPPDKLQCFAQVDDPVVELLRVPVRNPELLIRQWQEYATDSSGSAAMPDKLHT